MLRELAASGRKEAGLLPSALGPPGSSVPQERALSKWQSITAMEQWPMKGSPLQRKELALEGLAHASGRIILLNEASSELAKMHFFPKGAFIHSSSTAEAYIFAQAWLLASIEQLRAHEGPPWGSMPRNGTWGAP